MPIHDWTRVKPGIFHAFHHSWIEELARALNSGLLPPTYYALAEQHAAGFGPDVLALQGSADEDAGDSETNGAPSPSGPGGQVLIAPKLPLTAETEMEFYRRKQNAIAVRHASGDSLVAMIEIVSQGNKSSRAALRKFVEKAASLLDRGIHLLIVDLYPPGRRDPQGIHGAIWEEIAGEVYAAPTDKQLTLAAYECALTTRAYIVHAAVGDILTDMPLFLEPQQTVDVPLEATYQAAFAAVPQRWRRVLEP
jgi:hypothetical protein